MQQKKIIDLSIIIVNYKSWGVLQNCINSIKGKLSSLSYEVIIVDNQSNDDCFKTFHQNNGWVKLLSNKGNYGFSSGCNFGSKFAQSNFLLFLNPDTEITDELAIIRMLQIAKNKDQGIISCRKITPGNKVERELTFLNPWLTFGFIRTIYKKVFFKRIESIYPNSKSIWNPEWVTGSIFLLSRENFELIGGLSEKDYWMYFEEMDLAQKIRKINKKITLIRNVSIIHHHGGSSRVNPITYSITKSELIASRHVYIENHYSKNIENYFLHIAVILTSILSQASQVIFTLPFFWSDNFRKRLLLLAKTVKYYLNAVRYRSWKSRRINLKL